MHFVPHKSILVSIPCCLLNQCANWELVFEDKSKQPICNILIQNGSRFTANACYLFTNASSVRNLWNDSHIFSRLFLCTWLLNPTQPSNSSMRLPTKELRSLYLFGLYSRHHCCILIASMRALLAAFELILNPGSSMIAWMIFLNTDIGFTPSQHSKSIIYAKRELRIRYWPWKVTVATQGRELEVNSLI